MYERPTDQLTDPFTHLFLLLRPFNFLHSLSVVTLILLPKSEDKIKKKVINMAQRRGIFK